jgi:hypothetical protein
VAALTLNTRRLSNEGDIFGISKGTQERQGHEKKPSKKDPTWKKDRLSEAKESYRRLQSLSTKFILFKCVNEVDNKPFDSSG